MDQQLGMQPAGIAKPVPCAILQKTLSFACIIQQSKHYGLQGYRLSIWAPRALSLCSIC